MHGVWLVLTAPSQVGGAALGEFALLTWVLVKSWLLLLLLLLPDKRTLHALTLLFNFPLCSSAHFHCERPYELIFLASQRMNALTGMKSFCLRHRLSSPSSQMRCHRTAASITHSCTKRRLVESAQKHSSWLEVMQLWQQQHDWHLS